MKLTGAALIVGDDVDTDVIIPARYLTTIDPQLLASHCLEDLGPEIASRVGPDTILVAGRNFGCGSSREHAPLAIKTAGIGCVIAESFGRIFFRNAINIGLPVLVCPPACKSATEGDRLEVDLATGVIHNLSQHTEYPARPFPAFLQQIIQAGGLIAYTRMRLAQR